MEHACNGFFREQWARARICSRNLQALFDVIPCLVCVQRAKLSANSNSLFELPETDRIQFLVEFGLPDQHDLQQLVVVGFEVRQKADFLKDVRRQVVCLIDNEDRCQPIRTALDQKLPQVEQ